MTLDAGLLNKDPGLIIGWRDAPRSLQAGTVPLDQNTFGTMREVCHRTLGFIAGAQKVPYHPQGSIDRREEYFWISVSNLPKPPSAPAGGSPLLIEILKSSSLEPLDMDMLGGEKPFTFYAITFKSGNRRIAFIKKTDPKRVIEKGSVFLRYGESLKKVSTPHLVLESDIDLVVTNSDVYIINRVAFEQLLSDYHVATHQVAQHVSQVAGAFGASISLTPAAQDALTRVCESRPALASRLRDLPSRISRINLNVTKLRNELRKHGASNSLLLTGNKLDFTEDNVNAFLDIMEGRWFEDDLGRENRRADRYRLR